MLWWIITAVAAVAVDQFTKWIVVTHLKPINSFPLWQDVLHLTYVENTGAAFGMLKDHRWVFLIVSTIAIIAMIVFMILQRKNIHPLFGVAMGMIIGGGIGNMIDRTLNGFAVDFIDFTLINFAVFNGADSCICVGGGLLVIYVIFIESRKEKKKKEEYERNRSIDSGS
ncbi:MAG: signal peptidase II [Oscillospiraceae bacterium]|nr:signal peptidase II [Oscillospiraceae bacterium]